MLLQGKDIVLGVTGGIAAYKAVEVASRLRKLGAEVFVIMTKNACEFVTPLTFETISNHPVVTDTFARPETWEVEHIALAKRAALFLIAPATANILAKMAHGIADDMLSTTVLATRAPILLAPAMNTNMWEAEATRENMQVLARRGVLTVGPGSGFLAEGTYGMGRMAEPEEIVEAVKACLAQKQDFDGLKVLVTAGPTRERIDPVRYMTNDSSGKMGYAIARQAMRRGAKVTLVTGPVQLPAPEGVEIVNVETTGQMHDAVLGLCAEQDVLIQAAAPADYRFAHPSDQKIKKQAGQTLVLEMEENPDIAAAVGRQKKSGQILIGFAAETQNLLENARAKLQKKNLDMIVANDVTLPGAGFHVDTNIAALITKEEVQERPLQTKIQLADDILDMALKLKAQA
jgi:phosphopantothenoylcysteine decarboxylase/phosphopantothenate--cysteine ligase